MVLKANTAPNLTLPCLLEVYRIPITDTSVHSEYTAIFLSTVLTNNNRVFIYSSNVNMYH